MTFWIVILGLAAAAAGLLVLALARREGRSEAAAALDVGVYRDQLRAVERDLARGVVTADEAEAIRTEVSRRLLAADREAGSPATETRGPVALAGVVIAVLVVAGAVGIYWQIGGSRFPGVYPDLPLADRIAMAEEARRSRPGQAEAEAQAKIDPVPPDEVDPAYLDLMEQLRAAVANRPDDLQGQRLLAQNEARLGNFAAAHAAQAEVLRILGEETTARDWAYYADLLVIAAGGFVSPEAERAVEAALTRDPVNGTARYYAGLLATQTGRPDMAFRIWRRLLEDSRPEAPWVPPIRAQIETLARMAGVEYALPAETAGPRGPNAGDIAAADQMSPAERMEMIANMVAGLAERLATEGGPPEDWARLIRAYGVLGQRDTAAAIWAEAQQVFPDDAARVPILQAARDAGVAQ